MAPPIFGFPDLKDCELFGIEYNLPRLVTAGFLGLEVDSNINNISLYLIDVMMTEAAFASYPNVGSCFPALVSVSHHQDGDEKHFRYSISFNFESGRLRFDFKDFHVYESRWPVSSL